MASAPEDKRTHPRLPWVLRVDYPDRDRCLDATENLSQGGLFIQTDQTFDVGQPVPLSLSFPGLLDPIELVGVVAWVRPSKGEERGGVGIRVEREADKKRLSELVQGGAPTPGGGSAPSALPKEGFRILIVEDNPHIIDMYSYVLRKLASGELAGKVPLEVHFAPDGHSALQQLREKPFNLILTDLYMPVMDGFALVERIRHEEALKSIPVIAISAGGRDAQQKALDLGVDIYLRKPVRFVEVLETVKQLLHIK
ncbi:MAG: TIGR02266 family protein [Myxococcaceae bacterium]|nr:TIGR02266 family protein [Myxococcaceae bacterium]